jgi:hypothetical protein
VTALHSGHTSFDWPRPVLGFSFQLVDRRLQPFCKTRIVGRNTSRGASLQEGLTEQYSPLPVEKPPRWIGEARNGRREFLLGFSLALRTEGYSATTVTVEAHPDLVRDDLPQTLTVCQNH